MHEPFMMKDGFFLAQDALVKPGIRGTPGLITRIDSQ